MAGGQTYGVNAPKINDALKVWIRGEDGTTVCGILGPGTSQELQANWTSPFEGEAIGEKLQKTGALVQGATGTTSITTLQSKQAWQGNRPMTFTLEMVFFALSDPQNEVTNAIRELQRMMSPDVQGTIPVSLSNGGFELGSVPPPVVINVGRLIMYKDCVIESVSRPYDAGFTADGHQIKATVSLQVSTINMLNRSDIV